MLTLSPGGQILIVGSKPSNFEQSWLKSPRLVFWHSTNAKISSQKSLPVHVEAVLFTKFVRHALSEKVQDMARKSGIKFFRFVQGTGEIKRLIGESGILRRVYVPPVREEKPRKVVMPVEAAIVAEVAVPVVTAIEPRKDVNEMKKKKGWLTAFVIENANLAAEDTKKEMSRLYDLSKNKGLQTTLGSVEACFYHQRRLAAQPASFRAKKSAKRRRGRRASVKTIEKFFASADIVAVALKEVCEENAALLTENKELKDKLKGLRSMFRKI